MNPDYEDVLSRIEEPPTWWDSHGYPRWGEPTDGATNIYASEGIVVRIGCQGCARNFLVVYEWGTWEHWNYLNDIEGSLLEQAKGGNPPEYGDPPRHGCVGDTMSSYAISTVRTWKRAEVGFEFEYETVDWPGTPEWMSS